MTHLTITRVTVRRHRPPEDGFNEPHTHDEVTFCGKRGDDFFCDWRAVIARDTLTPEMFQRLATEAMLRLEALR